MTAPDKAAPIPAEVHASMLWTIQRFRTSMQPGELLHTLLTNPVVQNWLADREARPSLPTNREEHQDRRWIAVDPTGLRGPERVTRLPQRANQRERRGYVVTEWVRDRQGGRVDG